MNATAPSASNNPLQRLAWLPVPFLLLVMAVLWVADSSAAYEPPHLLMALNLFFSLPGALLVAYQAGHGFLLRGNLGLLGFGCGMLFWGSAGPVGGILVPYGPGVVVTAHNLLVWLAALCHAAGVILAPWQRTAPRWPELWLAGTYAGTLTLVAIVVLATLTGAIPTFFIQGQGGTFPRQLVLGSTVALFVLTAVLLKRNRYTISSAFQDWYALALLLIAVGLVGVLIQSVFGSALGWTGRLAQYLGGVYLLVAAVVGLRETRDWGHPLETALGEARRRFAELIDLASDGIVLHERVSDTARGHFLQVNPAVCALLGYTAQEMRALTPLDLIAPEEREQIAGDAEAMDRDGRLRHEKTLLAKDGRRIPVEINTRQYQDQGRTLVISVIRDITERKQAEAALRANEATLNAILDATHESIWLFSAEGIVLKANATALTRFGKPASEVVGKRVIEILPADLAQSRMARLREAVEQGRPVEFEDERAGIHFRHSFYPVRDAAGSVTAVASFSRDITAQKRAEAAIRESEQFKQAVLDAVTAHVAVLDRDGAIVAVNKPWRRFAADHASEAGRPAPNTGIGANYLAICRAARGESAEGALEAHDGIAAVLAGRANKFSLEYPCHSPQAKHWFELTVTPLETAGGGAVVAHTDITAFWQLADQLRDERDRFARIAATVPGIICSFRRRPDGSACFPYPSPAIEDLCGLRPEDVAVSVAPLRALIHADDLNHLEAAIATSARAMTPWRDEFRVEHPRKGAVWVEGHFMPVREPDGGILWHGYVQDITERKRAERQLFATHERLQSLMDALPLGVAFSEDAICQHITGNRALLAHFEMTLQDNLSATAPEAMAAGRQVRYFHQGRELQAGELPLQRAVAERQVIPPLELEVRLPSGRHWLAEVTGAPLHDAKAQVIGGLAVVTDITERKRAEEALRVALDEKEVLLREVHHRVKNNLAAIIDLLELQREGATDPPTAFQLAELRDRIKSMALIHEMLYQSGHLSQVDFHGYLQALAGHLRDSLDPHGTIRLQVTAPAISMNLDTAMPCGLIVNELVTNAFKYAFPQSRSRPGTGTCEIAVTADWDGAAYRLTVADNGIGMPAGLDWTTTRTLGLRLVRMLGQYQLRGQIELDSARGTRFSLRFGPRSRSGSP